MWIFNSSPCRTINADMTSTFSSNQSWLMQLYTKPRNRTRGIWIFPWVSFSQLAKYTLGKRMVTWKNIYTSGYRTDISLKFFFFFIWILVGHPRTCGITIQISVYFLEQHSPFLLGLIPPSILTSSASPTEIRI